MTTTRDFDHILEKAFPQVIGLVITKDLKINACPINWQVVSTKYEKPCVVAIGLSHESFTYKTLIATKEFSYAYPSDKQLEDTIYCGTISGANLDKIKNTEFSFEPAKAISTPVLNEAVINFECKLVNTVDMENYSIHIGEIVHAHENTNTSLKKIYSLGGQNYGTIEGNVLKKGR